MSSNYLKIVARTFYRNRAYTFLNLAGLSVGFSIFMLSMIYVYYETHFEGFHQQAEKIYRLTYRYTLPDGYVSHWARVPFNYINELPHDVQGIKTLVRFQNHARKYIRVGNEKFRPPYVYVADKEVFSVFNFKLSAGDPASALANPHSVVISRSLAAKYFGKQDPIGREIFVIGDLDKTETLHHITGVMEDLPSNTHLPVDMLISFKNKEERSGWAYTYIQLEDGAAITNIEPQMPSFIRKYSSEDDAKNDALIFQPLRDIHLHSDLAREIVPNGKILYVRIVGFAGLLILIVATINFMNLNSALALRRAKEIGMRKVLGASRRKVISYLLIESVANNMVALMIGGCIVYFALPLLKDFASIQFQADLFWFTIAMIGVAIACGLASGIYPAIMLGALTPIYAIRTNSSLTFSGGGSAFSLKRVMVTLQFCITVILLGSTVVAYRQLRFLNEKNLGISRDQIIAIPAVPDKVKEGFATFKNSLLSQPGIVGVSACMEVPSREIRDAGPVLLEGHNSDKEKAPRMDIQVIDTDFASLLGLEFVAGENIPALAGTALIPEFNDSITLESYLVNKQRDYLINETAMRRLGWDKPEEAIGQRISWSIGGMVLAPGPIRGVVRDFHQESLKNKVDPVIMVQEPVWLRTFLIKIETRNIKESVEKVTATWNNQFPLYSMEYYFLDDLYENLYKGDRVQLQLLFIFSGLSIMIAFIGLVGLIAYALRTRVREIAVSQGARRLNAGSHQTNES
jgi:putative ABC transport system permease protein